MRNTVLLFLLAFFAIGTPIAASAGDKPVDCRLKMFADVPLELSEVGMPYISVSVSGAPRTFLLDAGATESVISASAANALGLSTHSLPGTMILFGGVRLKQFVSADKFAIGKMVADRFPLIYAPSSALPPTVDGLLGADVLSNYDVEFDFAKSRFKLFSPDHCSGQVVYWTASNYARVPITLDSGFHIHVPVTLDGQQATAIVDTGAETSVIGLGLVRSLFGLAADDARLKPRAPYSFNGLPRSSNYTFPFQTLTLEGLAVQNPRILVMPDQNMGPGSPPLLLGISILRQLHVYIAYKERALYVTDAEAR